MEEYMKRIKINELYEKAEKFRFFINKKLI